MQKVIFFGLALMFSTATFANSASKDNAQGRKPSRKIASDHFEGLDASQENPAATDSSNPPANSKFKERVEAEHSIDSRIGTVLADPRFSKAVAEQIEALKKVSSDRLIIGTARYFESNEGGRVVIQLQRENIKPGRPSYRFFGEIIASIKGGHNSNIEINDVKFVPAPKGVKHDTDGFTE